MVFGWNFETAAPVVLGGPKADAFPGVNHDPTISAPVTATVLEGGGSVIVNLLEYAADTDLGAVLHGANLDWIESSGLPAGFAVSNDGASLRINGNDPAYNSLAGGGGRTFNFTYDVVDDRGASVQPERQHHDHRRK